MSSFAPTALPQVAPYDPTKHVNFSVGMVLGVDDFNQEFTYLDASDRRIVGDLLGYGVVAGLQVTIDVDPALGPRVNVAPGEAITPSGRFVRVSPSQCAYLNDWIAANPSDVGTLGSPPAPLRLAVVASWQESPTDQVPIPGEPCRSDSELMAPSRLQESFALDLRTTPPAQLEESAVRDFVAWLRRIPFVDGPAGDPAGALASFSSTLSAAAGLAASPPSSPPGRLDFLLAPPPAALVIPSTQASAYLDALMQFWVTELRPRLRSPASGAECDCAGGSGALDPDAGCVLLAELEVPLVQDAVTTALRVSDEAAVAVDQTARPTLLHARLLQELLLNAGPSAGTFASGHVGADGTVLAGTGGLSATVLSPTVFLIDFPGYDPAHEWLVAGQPFARVADPAPSTFEVIFKGDPGLAPLLGSPPKAGIVVRARQSGGNAVPDGFTIRIERIGAGL
jgi:hypothetical protein